MKWVQYFLFKKETVNQIVAVVDSQISLFCFAYILRLMLYTFDPASID